MQDRKIKQEQETVLLALDLSGKALEKGLQEFTDISNKPALADAKNNASYILKVIDQLLKKHRLDLDDKDLFFTRCFNEAWFSNTLAWLLNPNGTHNFKVKFANEFLKTVAQARSNKLLGYNRRKSYLKWGKGNESGALATHFSLDNAAVIREFYLAQSIRKQVVRGPRYCDIVFLDLDTKDSLFMVIENKLFSSNHPYQLEEYHQLVEENYKRVKVREYIYLTLNGVAPLNHSGNPNNTKEQWVQLSWSKDILDILNDKKLQLSDEHPEVTQLKQVLT